MTGFGVGMMRASSILVAIAATLSSIPAVWGLPSGIDSSRGLEPLKRPHPGQPLASSATVEGTDLLKKGAAIDAAELAHALELIEGAIRYDPLNSDAWVNWSAGLIRACEPKRAMFAALTARELDPTNQAAAQNLQMARKAACDEPDTEPGAVAEAERGVLGGPSDPELWTSAAEARRNEGARRLSAFYELLAVMRGADAEGARWRAHEDLASAGHLRGALELISAHTGERAVAAKQDLESRLAAHGERAARILERVSRLESFDGASHAGYVAGFSEVLLARGESDDAVVALLKDVLGLGGARRVETRWGAVDLLPGWFSVEPLEGEGKPIAVFRRFPGDTQIAIFSMRRGGELTDDDGLDREVAKAMSSRSPVRGSDWKGCAIASGNPCHASVWIVALGWGGTADLEIRVVDGPESRFAVTSLVGDGGCGKLCRELASTDVANMLRTLELTGAVEGATETWRYPVPRAWRSEGDHREDLEPWRSFPAGDGVRVDMPPGIASASPVPGARLEGTSIWTELWFRGRFVDRDGIEVVLGDDRHAGWVDLLPRNAPGRDERLKRPRPHSDPQAELAGVSQQDELVRRVGTGRSFKISRFEGEEFDGDWLVSHVELAGSGALVEVGVPVKKGIKSLSLLWLALTARDSTRSGPPPLVDLEERYAVQFEPVPVSERSRDPREGWLRSKEFQVAIPRGFRLSMRSESVDGFPLTLRSPNGAVGEIVRWPAAAGSSPEGQRRRAGTRAGAELEWGKTRQARGGVSHAASGSRTREETGESHPVCAVLLLPAKLEERASYFIVLERGNGVSDGEWGTMCETVRTSGALRKTDRSR